MTEGGARLLVIRRDPQELPLFAIGSGHLLVVLSRTGDFQLGYVIPKGTFPSQKAEGLETLRADVARMQPILADRVSTLTDWKQITVLSVESSRVTTWFRPGLLLIGDAARTDPSGGRLATAVPTAPTQPRDAILEHLDILG